LNFKSIGAYVGALGINVLGKAVAGLSVSTISTVSGTVTSFLGGGAVGSFLGSSAVTVIGTITAASPVALPFISFTSMYCIYNSILNKREMLIKKLKSLPPLKPIFIEIEPKITAPSIIDDRVLVSKFTWAVTLVSNGGATLKGGKPNEISYGNHAEIYIEGINDGFFDIDSVRIKEANLVKNGEKFLHLAHYQPRIESGLLSPNDFKYEKRTEIWMVSCEKVKKMLQSIELEKKPKDGKYHHPYNELGANAYIGENGHNCFTWATYHLKSIGIELKGKEMPPSIAGFVAALVTDYTKKPTECTEKPIQRI
jgi:hypothetical protein